MSFKKLNIALIVYACDPFGGSEGGVGWGILKELSKNHNIFAYVEKDKFQSNILRYKKNNPGFLKNVKFFFIKRRRFNFLRKVWPPSYFYFYREWQSKVYNLIKNHKEHLSIDIVHVCTLVGYRIPGPFYKLSIPLVWGPIGGMGYFDLAFKKFITKKGLLYYIVYNSINWFTTNYSVTLKKAIEKTQKKGNGLICADDTNSNIVKRKFFVDAIKFPEVGPPENFKIIEKKHKKNTKIKLIWIGLMEDRKGMLLAIKIFENLNPDLFSLDVLGDGPLINYYRKVCKIKKLNINFYGKKSRDYTLNMLQKSDLLLFTSFRDLTATVTVEANINGIPVIAINHCGFGYWLSKDHNLFVNPQSDLIKEFCKRINNFKILKFKEKIKLQNYTNEVFSWKNKVNQLNLIYEQKIAH